MIDHSKFLPLYALPVAHDKLGVGGVLCYSLYPVNGTFNTLWPGKIKNYNINKDPGHKAIVWDWFKKGADGTSVLDQKTANPPLYKRQVENYESNKKIIKPVSHTRYHTVVICGAGPSLENDIDAIEANRDKYAVITINSAHKRIVGDYFVTCESLDLSKFSSTNKMLDLKADIYSDTIAHLATITHPNVVGLPWRKVSWFTHNFDFEDKKVNEGLPIYYVGRHSTYDAIQFASLILRAKKIIFAGMNYIYDDPKKSQGKKGYVDMCSLSLIEAASLICSFNKIDVWNVSKPTAFRNGVKLGTFEEALRSCTKSRGKKRRK